MHVAIPVMFRLLPGLFMLACFAFTSLGADAQDFSSNLVAYWKLDDGSGTTAVDSSGNGHDGTVTGNPAWQSSAKIAGGLDFETTDGVDRIDVGTFDLSGSGVSIAAWIRWENGFSDSRIVIKSNSNNGADQLWGMTVTSNGRVDFRIRVGGTFVQLDSADGATTSGQWHHVAGTYDGTTMRLYIDGTEVASTAHKVGGAVDQDASAPVALGDSPQGSRTFDGVMDDVRIYDRALSEKDIATLHAWSPKTYYVRTDGDNSNTGTGTSAAEAWATITGAATKALAQGDIVYVRAGTYAGSVAPTVDGTVSNPIKFIADTYGTVFGTPGYVTIQSDSGDHALDVQDDDYLTFSGFKLQGHVDGSDTVDFDAEGLVLEKCEIYGATGAGIDADGGSAKIVNCLIRDNTGDGISLTLATLEVINTTITANGSDGIEQHSGESTVSNCIIAFNNSDGLDLNSGKMSHAYNIVFGHGSQNFEGTSLSFNELEQDPLFRGGGDYSLQEDSPAIDFGYNASNHTTDDLAGISRPVGSSYDLGCYEWYDTLIGHWKLDETSGTDAADSSSIANDGFFWNGATPSSAGPYPGVGAVAGEFYGNNAHIGIYEDSIYNKITDKFSIAVWVNFDQKIQDQTFQQYLVERSSWGDQTGFALMTDQPWTNQILFRVMNGSANGDAAWDDPEIEAGTWYHVVGTYNGSEVKLYVNGELKDTTAFTGMMLPDSGTNLNLGNQVDGRLFDARIYHHALSHSEVSELYGLVAHWKLDETSGSIASDSTGKGRDGTITGDQTWVASGKIDGAFDFETTDGVDIIDVGTFDLEGSGASISTWIKVEDGFSDSRIVIKSNSNSGADQLWGMTVAAARRLDFRIRSGGTFNQLDSANDEIVAGTWHHCVGTYDETTMRLYIDGVEVPSLAHTVGGAGDTDASAPVALGDSPQGSRTFDGLLDDARVYNRPLSVAEIAALYAAGSAKGLRIIKWVEVK